MLIQLTSFHMCQEAKTKFTTSLTDLAELELERDSSLLARDRGKATNLIEGAVDRSGIYKSIEHDVDAFISKHLHVLTETLRELRKSEVGEEVAALEEKAGMKSDEEYARDAEHRQQVRESQRLAEVEEQRKLEHANQKAKEAEEKEKQRQREMQREKELQQEIDMLREREAQREKAMERERAEQREKVLQREQEQENKRLSELENEKLLYEEQQRARQRDESQRRRDREHAEGQRMRARADLEFPPRPLAHNATEDFPEVKEVQIRLEEEKDWEQEALNLLLKEGQEHAAKAQQRPELDRSESLEPPPRMGQSVKGARAESSTRRSLERPDDKTMTPRVSSPSLRPPSLAIVDQTSTRNHMKDRSRRHSREHHHHRRRSTSRSRPSHTSRWGDERNRPSMDSKEAYKKGITSRRERESEAYGRDPHNRRGIDTTSSEVNRRSTGIVETSIRAQHDPSREDSQWRGHDKRNPPTTRRRSRSRSPRHGRRGRSRSHSSHRRGYRERSPRRRHGSRSRSPIDSDNYRHRLKRGQGQSPPPRKRDRSPGQDRGDRPRHVDIDRYVPG